MFSIGNLLFVIDLVVGFCLGSLVMFFVTLGLMGCEPFVRFIMKRAAKYMSAVVRWTMAEGEELERLISIGSDTEEDEDK